MDHNEQLRSELEASRKEADHWKKQAEENERYRAAFENRVNRNAKDSVFLNLFSIPKYQMAIYQELFPEDKDIRPEDLELFRVERVLTNHPYNDLGLLVRRKLILLGEAESEWNENNIYRIASYYFDSMETFIDRTGMNVHHKAKIDLLDVEAVIIYPGSKELNNDRISLRDVFFGGLPDKPDFTARVIHGNYEGGIIAEYMGFCRILDEQRKIHKNDLAPEKWIESTIELCIKKGFLSEYLTDHRTEVQQIMFEMYNPANVAAAERKTELFETEIKVARRFGASDEAIRDMLVEEHGMTPTYAMNLVKCEPSKDTVMAV